MGMHVNPGNEGFQRIIAGEYIDKTGLVALVNEGIGTSRNMTCVTRPRRFGKTFAAEALVAYYSCGCDSRSLFEGLAISRHPSFEKHLNAYNVVRLDMAAFDAQDPVAAVSARVLDELRQEFPQVPLDISALDIALTNVVDATGRKFVFVVDEWDAPLRDHDDPAFQEAWVRFLRLLFKNAAFTAKVVAAAYLTGILPIKRYGTQSALTDFREYTMLDPGAFAPYAGFGEGEVAGLAARHSMDPGELGRWYDGYELPYYDEDRGEWLTSRTFAPYSVIEACQRHKVGSYWASSEAFSSLLGYFDLDFDGLQQTILQAVGGASVPVDTNMFSNDIREMASADDVLTLLCHLGYLAYDEGAGTARVPNEEVRAELRRAARESRHPRVAAIVRDSTHLLESTWDLDSDEVAACIQRAHDNGCAPAFYNNEQALRAVVRSAYLAAADHYATVEELPSGRGVADVVYLPRRGDPSPALVVELKWNRTPQAAIAQILDRDYPAVLRDWGGPIICVGVSYDPKTKAHACRIETLAEDAGQ